MDIYNNNERLYWNSYKSLNNLGIDGWELLSVINIEHWKGYILCYFLEKTSLARRPVFGVRHIITHITTLKCCAILYPEMILSNTVEKTLHDWKNLHPNYHQIISNLLSTKPLSNFRNMIPDRHGISPIIPTVQVIGEYVYAYVSSPWDLFAMTDNPFVNRMKSNIVHRLFLLKNSQLVALVPDVAALISCYVAHLFHADPTQYCMPVST